MDDAGAAGEPDREAEPGRVLGRQHRGPPEVEVVPLEQELEAVGLGQPVVVHQPDQVGAPLDRLS